MSLILLVDDDEALRKMLRLSITKFGHTVSEARNGREALEACRFEPPDLVITDLIMPEKEGLETISDLRRLHPDVRIIATSGGGRNSSMDYLKIARRMGAAAVLSKPFSVDELRATIDSVLGDSDKR